MDPSVAPPPDASSTVSSPAEQSALSALPAQSIDAAVPAPHPSKARSRTKALGGLGLVVALGLYLAVSGVAKTGIAVLRGDYGKAGLADQVRALASGDAIKEYVAPDGFKISFPGYPAIDRDSLSLQNHQFPYVSYTRSIKSGAEQYLVEIIDARNAPTSVAEMDLDEFLNTVASSFGAAKLESSTLAKLGGLVGREGSFTSSLGGRTGPAYARAVTKDGQLYLVLTVGAAYPDFFNFADSFQFTKP